MTTEATTTVAATAAATPSKRKGVGRGRRRPTTPRAKSSITLTVIMVIMFVYVLLPLVWLVINSTKTNGGLFSSFGLWFADDFALWDNIKALFSYQNSVYPRWLANTVPHAGTDSVLWRSIVGLGADLVSLGEIAGSTVQSQTAVLFDWESWWASEIDSHPSNEFRYRSRVLSWYRSLWQAQVGTAVVPADADLAGYRLVVVPHLYLADASLVARLTAFAEAGGTVVITYFSGIANSDDHIHLGGYPGAFRDLLGVRVEEFAPVLPGDTITLESALLGEQPTGSGWSEPVGLVDAAAQATFTSGPSAGWPAITRAARGAGSAWYVTTDLSDDARAAFVDALLAEAEVAPLATAPAGVELVVRRAGDGTEFLFVLNHTDAEAVVEASGVDLLTGTTHTGSVTVEAAGVVVLRRTAG